MAETINAHCKICGKGYHVCASCLAQKGFTPWRTVTDTAGHYKIYLALHGYTLSHNKEKARTDLAKCDLSGLEHFNPEIRSAIQEIIGGRQMQSISGMPSDDLAGDAKRRVPLPL